MRKLHFKILISIRSKSIIFNRRINYEACDKSSLTRIIFLCFVILYSKLTSNYLFSSNKIKFWEKFKKKKRERKEDIEIMFDQNNRNKIFNEWSLMDTKIMLWESSSRWPSFFFLFCKANHRDNMEIIARNVTDDRPNEPRVEYPLVCARIDNRENSLKRSVETVTVRHGSRHA